MLNMIKMDLYRMFRTKSMYVVWIVLAVSVLFTTFMCKTDYDSLSKEDTVRQEQFAEPTAENINVRSEEHTSELQSQATISYAVFCLKKKFF